MMLMQEAKVEAAALARAKATEIAGEKAALIAQQMLQQQEEIEMKEVSDKRKILEATDKAR
jgi:hypothetical protein